MTVCDKGSHRMRQSIFHRVFAVFLALAVTTGCSPKSVDKPAAPPSSGAIDFARVRAEYGEREDFGELCEQEHPIKNVVELVNAARFEEVLAVAEPWLARCPVDIDMRFVAAIALTELGRSGEAEEHAVWYRGLIESILASGDGEAPETAYQVISVGEEYAMLRAFNLTLESQSLVEGRIDALTVEGESGKGVVYFNPAAHFRRLGRRLGESE